MPETLSLYHCAECDSHCTKPERNHDEGWWCPRCYSNQKSEPEVYVREEKEAEAA